MKSFVFKLGAVFVAIMAIKALACPSMMCPLSTLTSPPPRPVVVHQVNVHDHDTRPGSDRGRSITYVERDGQRIVSIDDLGVSVALRDDDEEGQEHDRRGRDRVATEGLPVPVVPGSRVSEARFEPPAPPAPKAPRPPKKARKIQPPKPPKPPVQPAPAGAGEKTEIQVIPGRLSATEERARKDARLQLETMLARRLAPEVPASWKIPPQLVDGLVREITITPRERDYGTVYEATLKVDVSPRMTTRIVRAYHHEQMIRRLGVLGAGLAFVLVCLGALSGYIKADEATKGYYTSRLRLAAAAGVGAGGVLIYRLIARG
jgi:hypothetical protein